jgi:SIR2-like domain
MDLVDPEQAGLPGRRWHVDRQNRRTKWAYEALEDPDIDGFLDAANILNSQLKQHGQFLTWLESAFGSLSQNVRHPAALEVLKELHEQGAVLLTSNYDDMLENYCSLESIGRSKWDDIMRFRLGDLDGVFHLHGTYVDPDEVVLDTAAYYQVTHSDEVRNMLQAFLDDKTTLFVGHGSGLEDPNLDGLLEWVRQPTPFHSQTIEHLTVDDLVCLQYLNN